MIKKLRQNRKFRIIELLWLSLKTFWGIFLITIENVLTLLTAQKLKHLLLKVNNMKAWLLVLRLQCRREAKLIALYDVSVTKPEKFKHLSL